jgi:hypothetical protein
MTIAQEIKLLDGDDEAYKRKLSQPIFKARPLSLEE